MIRLYSHRDCLEHLAAPGYPERPERLTGVLDHLTHGGAELSWVEGHPAASDTLVAVHGQDYLDRFRRAVERGDGLLDSADNPLSAGTFAAALGAVAACLAAADRVAGEGRGAMALVRPPGHHAERQLAMGFCFFANACLAAEHLRRTHGLTRLAIVDFDVHHGNGTQSLTEADPDLLFVSLHQYPFYPGSGAAGEVGVGPGRGTVLNVPLEAGCGDDEYAVAFDRVERAVEDFAPAALVVSAGFDAWRGDPLGGMRVTEAGFGDWGNRLGALAERCCDGRILSVLEGGYDLPALPSLVERYLAGLASSSTRASAG